MRRDFPIYGLAAGDAPEVLVAADPSALDFGALIKSARAKNQSSAVLAGAGTAVLASSRTCSPSRWGARSTSATRTRSTTTMLGFLVVVDTPWYAVADGSGNFQIKNVPPGEYEASVWHESGSAPQKKKVTVEEGSRLAFTVAADKRPNPFPPDKYGKPREQQPGY